VETSPPPNRKLRLLYSFPDTLGAPGIGTTAYHQAQGLIERGHDVTVVCTYLARPLPGVADVLTTLEVAGRRVPHRALGRARAYRRHDERVAGVVRHLGTELDVVHTWPRATIRTAAAANAVGVPTVRELPNAHTGYAYDVVARELESLGLEPQRGHSHTLDSSALELEEAEFRAADLLVAPSDFVRRTFLERGFAPEHVARHQYGFEPERFPPPDEPRAGGRDALRALFMGRCEPRKGLHHALRGWVDSGAAERGRLVVCGTFYPGYREVLPLLTHPSVEILGFTDDPGAVMRSCDVLVLPSIEEGSALVTYEAQGSGCALVVSDAAGAVCEHMQHGLVHPAGDVATLTSHLELVAGDTEALSGLRDGARAHREELTWAYAARVLEQVYVELLERRAER
jgi:glycosyltransferase involved in cell wall biosynthesis